MRRLEDAGFAVEPAEPGCLLLRHARRRAALRRRRAGARAGARGRRRGLGRARRRGRAAVRRARGGERGAAGPGAGRLRRADARLPRAAAADAAPARGRPPRGARGARRAEDRTACRATGRRRGRTIGAGRPARLEPGEGRGRDAGRAAAGDGDDRRGARVPGAGRERAHAAAGARRPARPRCSHARSATAARSASSRSSARLVGGGSWRRTLTLRDATGDRTRLRAALGPKLAELPAPVLRLRLELAELSESRGEQLELVAPAGEELRTRLREGLRQVRASAGVGVGLHRRGGRAVVAHPGAAGAARTARRLNARRGRRSSRRMLDGVAADGRTAQGSPSCARSGASSTAGGRRSRSSRRYFEVVLETGENTRRLPRRGARDAGSRSAVA